MALLWTMSKAEQRRFEKAGAILKALIAKADARARRQARAGKGRK